MSEMIRGLGAEIVAIILRTTLIGMATLVVILLLRGKGPVLRHFTCRAALMGCFLLPVADLFAPLPLAERVSWREADLARLQGLKEQVLVGMKLTSVPPAAIEPSEHSSFDWTAVIAWLYLCGLIFFLLRLTTGWMAVRRLVDRSQAIGSSEGKDLAYEVWSRSLPQRNPGIFVSEEIGVPMAAGLINVCILLPRDWPAWHRTKLLAALRHEVEHVRRGDPRTAFFAALAGCLFWPSPLVHWLRRHLLAEAEYACDDAVLEELPAQQYAEVLIDFSSQARVPQCALIGTSPVFEEPLIQTRLKRIMVYRVNVTQRVPMKVQSFSSRIALTACLLPGLYFAACLRLGQSQDLAGLSIGSDKEAAVWESRLRVHPDDLQVREALMAYYFNQAETSALTRHLIWVIHHHPESNAAMIGPERSQRNSERDPVRLAWEEAMERHPDSALVLIHAAMFLSVRDPRGGLDVLRRAERVAGDPQLRRACWGAEANVYAIALREQKQGMKIDAAAAARLRAELESLRNPEIFSRVGRLLAELGSQAEGMAWVQRAIELIRAMRLSGRIWNGSSMNPCESGTCAY